MRIPRSYGSTALSSPEIRARFINFFLNNNHVLIKSSPVKPYADPTLEFVNAGMNQFKNVFMGVVKPPALRVTNSQKCIRIGGKHNDLEVVGHDSYHHTFFEMMGNWSFGDYFKEDACRYAVELITSPPYCLPFDQLYFTYFSGDKNLGLPPDLEVKSIWRGLGVPEGRILPFGMKENFWEMGLSGPCGPCTEIHYDHLGSESRPNDVNRDLDNLTELWNLVFIQYQRLENGKVTSLETNYVDTGLGLERLVTLLQSKKSNYDTDLFIPLFETIHRVSGIRPYQGLFGSSDVDGVDTNYRILADHARMITVSLADNMLPDYSHGLRRVIRKSLLVADCLLPNSGLNLLLEVCHGVSESLKEPFPEVFHNWDQVEVILKDEHSLWESVKLSTKKEWKKLLQTNPALSRLSDSQSMGLIEAYKFIKSPATSDSLLPSDVALICYERYGLSFSLIEELALIKGYKIDQGALMRDLTTLKKTLKEQQFSKYEKTSFLEMVKSIPETNDSFKFNYTRNADRSYKFPKITSRISAIFHDQKLVKIGDNIPWNSKVALVSDETNFHSSSKGAGDKGVIELSGLVAGRVLVEEAINYAGRVLHIGTLHKLNESCTSELLTNDVMASFTIDPSRRLQLMRNATAALVFSSVLSKFTLSKMIEFSSDYHKFSCKFLIFGRQITEDEVLNLENGVNSIIKSGSNLRLSTMFAHQLLFNCNVAVPQFLNAFQGSFQLVESAPDSEIKCRELSSSPCLLDVTDIEELSILDFKCGRRFRELTLTCSVNGQARAFSETTKQLLVSLDNSNKDEFEASLAKLQLAIKEVSIPLRLKSELEENIKKIKNEDLLSKSLGHREILGTLYEERKPHGYLIYYADEDVKLEKLTSCCKNLPALIFAYNRGALVARCTTPSESTLRADGWLGAVCSSIGGEVGLLKGHDPSVVCVLKPVRIPPSVIPAMLQKATAAASKYAESVISGYRS